jgi:hypothetical protein
MKEYHINLPIHLKDKKLELKQFILSQHYEDSIFSAGFCACLLGIDKYDFQSNILGKFGICFWEDYEKKPKRKHSTKTRLIVNELLPLICFYKQKKTTSRKNENIVLKFLLPDCFIPEEREFQIYCAIKLIKGKYINKKEAMPIIGYPEEIFNDLYLLFEDRYKKISGSYNDTVYKDDPEEMIT